MKVTNRMRKAWDQMDYHEVWHDPAYKLMRVEEAFAKETEAYYAQGSLDDPEAREQCDTFSSSSCELCGDPLGGERHCLIRVHPKEDSIYYSVCSDCQYYCEYGQLDDQSMLDIEDLYGV